MKSIIVLVFSFGIFFLPHISRAQEFDKKTFCRELNLIVTQLSQSSDSLKGNFIGENSLGVRQWSARYLLKGASDGFYERTLMETTEEYRATYSMIENTRQKEAEELYRQIVQAVRWCYGVDYTLSEQETSEWDNSGDKHRHYDAMFTFAGVSDKGIEMPVILVRSFSIESGLYAVTLELYIVQ